MILDEVLAAFKAAPANEQVKAAAAAHTATAAYQWVPNPGPQTAAFFCEADELLFGGEAGGGKSDFLIGLALTQHKRARILRRINQDAGELGERLCDILGTRGGYRSSPPTWKRPAGDGFIEMRGCELEVDKQRFKGKARDANLYDELADFLESQYVFINNWTRSSDPNQRCRVVGATNGPTTPEGQWIVRRWAAWLDPNHPNPAKDGELRWYLTIEGKDAEVDGPGPHVIEGRKEPVRALSRTFIRSRLSDNPDYAKGDYAARLESLPEPLRRVYRDGDFTVGMKDDDFQVIPTAWIEAAMQRWKPGPPKGLGMTAMGVDVAQGGNDQTVVAHRYGGWYAPLDVEPGEKTREGKDVTAMVVRRRRNNCPVIVDLGGGYGGDAVIHMKENGVDCHAFNGVLVSMAKTRDGKLGFRNKRAEGYWKFREELDPSQEGGSPIALPDDPLLKADLAAARWELTTRGIQIEPKEDIKKRIGRSPDRADAVVMCMSEGQRALLRSARRSSQGARPAHANVGHSNIKNRR